MAEADPAHLKPLKFTDENVPLRIEDQLRRRFPNPPEGARHELYKALNLKRLDDRLRGPYGMGGPTYDDEDGTGFGDHKSVFKATAFPPNAAITNEQRATAKKLVSRRVPTQALPRPTKL